MVIGSGMGGLTTATQMAARGARVLVLEKYVIPGGSAGAYSRRGYTFDVGSSMMFGFGEEGETNLLTRALGAVGKRLETVPDPTQIHYHLPPSGAHPGGLDVRVHRKYEDFVAELTERFPHEAEGIRGFYGECWKVFNSLNALELRSLEEPRYLLRQFARDPLACLTLASFLPSNAGDVARKHIKDTELLSFIDMECYCWSTVKAEMTPTINAGMVFCDRHYGGINYPVGGVGRIAEEMVAGLQERGGAIEYKADVVEIMTERAPEGDGSAGGEGARAVGVRLADGREIRARAVISNATRWDTFGRLVKPADTPQSERDFLTRYKKAPSFLTIHMGIDADALPEGCDCHHILLEDWARLEDPRGTLFVSIPSLLDPSVAPEGKHLFHAFTPDYVDRFEGLSPAEYRAAKEEAADEVVTRLEAIYFPGLAAASDFREVGSPKTHRRFLNREDGTYGPIPSKRPVGLLGMPFNRTDIDKLYCVGDSTFPGQGVNAVAFSGFACGHRALVDLGFEEGLPSLDGPFNKLLAAARGLV